jgi:hypothetical protein
VLKLTHTDTGEFASSVEPEGEYAVTERGSKELQKLQELKAATQVRSVAGSLKLDRFLWLRVFILEPP